VSRRLERLRMRHGDWKPIASHEPLVEPHHFIEGTDFYDYEASLRISLMVVPIEPHRQSGAGWQRSQHRICASRCSGAPLASGALRRGSSGSIRSMAARMNAGGSCGLSSQSARHPGLAAELHL
jgi:hypothetical protein